MDVRVRAIGALLANCYIVNKHIMIDPGDGNDALDSFIEDEKANIDCVLLTHGHFDHMLGASHIKSKYGAKVYVTGADAHCLINHEDAIVLPFAETTFVATQPDFILKEGSLQLGNTEFEVLFTPGHTPGGACFISRKDKCVFTGDTLFKHGYGRTDLTGGDAGKLFASLRMLLRLPGDYVVYPGHGESAILREIRGGYV